MRLDFAATFLYQRRSAVQSFRQTRKMKTPLRIAILECDTPLSSVVEKHGRYDRIFSALLETAAEGLGLSPKKDLVLSGFDVVDKQEYPNMEDIDAVLISGSSSSCTYDYDNCC